MAVWGHFKSLLWKNWLLWKRRKCLSICELLCPAVLLCFLLVFVVAFPGSEKHGNDNYIFDDVGQMVNSTAITNTSQNADFFNLYNSKNTQPFGWCATATEKESQPRWAINIVIDTTNKSNPYPQAMFNEIQTQLITIYNNTLAYNNSTHPLLIYQSNTISEVDDIITSSKYDDSGSVKFCFVVELTGTFFPVNGQTSPPGTPNVTLTLRFNSTSINPNDQSPYGTWYPIFDINNVPQISKFDRSQNTEPQKDFMNSGFLQMMNIVQNALLKVYGNVENPDISVGFVPMQVAKYLNDPMIQKNGGTIGFFLFISTIMPILRMISKIVSEKESKVREVMRIMGLTDTPYWLSWLVMYLIIYLIIAILCMLVTIPMFKYSNKGIVFLMFLLYGTSCISFSLFISSLFARTKTAILVGVALFLVSYFSLFTVTQTTPGSTKEGLSILPVAAMSLGFFTLLGFEGIQTGIHWDNINSEYQSYAVGTALLFLFLDTMIYGLLSLYFDKVIPTETGTHLPFYFPFSKNFWFGRSGRSKPLDEATQKLLDEEYAESQSRLRRSNNLEAVDAALLRQHETGQAMLIRKLRRHFGNKIAVDGIDLDIYEGQIFALLGHNGAGKTTTISMLTGMLEPTDGEMTINNMNFKTDMLEIRKQLGVCPQHNVLFNDLSVYEHLYLFSTFKGMRNKDEINAAIDEKLAIVNLKDKRHTPAKNLSGGQKRKLSLCMALIGGSQIVMLDEPTSGMDLTARRQVWDMLKNEKNKRIIILTTHYMEEADILADRIAIMAEGRVRCVGSPLFLKNRFGVGYNLTITKKLNVASPMHTSLITGLVQQFIPDAKMINDVSAEIMFQLPLTSSSKFKAFFEELDMRMGELELECYGVSVTTLEEVFLRVARGDDDNRISSSFRPLLASDPKSPVKSDSYEKIDKLGPSETFDIEPSAKFNIAENRERGSMYCPHVWALLKKRFLYGKRDWKGLCCEIFCPIVLVVVGLALLTKFSVFTDERSFTLSLSHLSTPQVINYGANTDGPNEDVINVMNYITSNYPGQAVKGEFNNTNATVFYDYTYAIRDNHPYRMGAYYFSTFDKSSHRYYPIIYQNTTSLQACGIYYSILGEAILQQTLGQDFRMTTVNHPMPLTNRQSDLASNTGTFYIAMIFAFGMAFVPTGIITFIVKEKENSIKHQHLVSGVSIPAYWTANFLWDILKHLIPAIVSVCFVLLFNLRSLTDTEETFLCVVLLFILFGFAVAPFTYFLSFFFESYSTAQFVIFLLNLISGAILATASWLMRIIASSSRNVNQVLQYIFRLSPIYCFSYGIMNASNRSMYQVVFGEKHQRGALDWQIAGADVIFLAAETVGYSLLIFLIEWGKTVKWMRNLSSAKDPGSRIYEKDDDVEAEMIEAENANPEDVAVKVVDVRKVYGTRFSGGEVKVAIEKVSFRVLHKECFALLGVNGAGKTSTFRILTGEYAPTTGNAFISGTSVLTNMAEARFKIGYCPQFDAISDLLTCKEHLELYGRIKGIPKRLIASFAQEKLFEMNLEQYANVRAGTLSGGNKRKLSVAMACIGNPPVVFLDEPSAGMDPDARKRMWKVINDIKSKKTSIILTTHSMDEAEALCDRMAIMVGGRIRCLGTALHIKNKFGSGYELIVKVRMPIPEEVASGVNRLNESGIHDTVRGEQLMGACQWLGSAEKANEINEHGKGAALYQELLQEGSISVDHLVEWFVIEHFCERIFQWLMREFTNVSTIEHFLTTTKFKIERAQDRTLGSLFGKVEEMKTTLGISEYSLSQTTLEQIFNTFALQNMAAEDMAMT